MSRASRASSDDEFDADGGAGAVAVIAAAPEAAEEPAPGDRSTGEAGAEGAKPTGKTKGSSGKGRGGGRPKGGKGMQKGGNHKGMRQCLGCWKCFKTDEFPAGSPYCADDKRAVNNITNASIKQGEVEWWTETKKDAAKFELALKAYHKTCPEPKDGKRRKAAEVLTIKSQVRTIQATVKDEVGEMMHLEAFIHWSMKAKNLGLSYDAARLEFKVLCGKPKAFLDEQGPPNSKLRVRVATKTLVIFRNEFQREKGYEVTEKPVKNPDAKAMENALKQAVTGLSEAAGSGNLNNEEVLQMLGQTKD